MGTKEIKKLYSIRVRQSVVDESKEYMKNDEKVKSFNDFIEKALISYISKQKKKQKEN